MEISSRSWFYSWGKGQTAHELEKENYNLSFEHYMGYQRKADYPDYPQAEAEFQQAAEKLIQMLEKYRQPWE